MIPQTEAIVLRTFDFRETSKIADFFTRDYGKISAILKGIRKDPRKFASPVDKFTINDLIYYHYRRTDLHLVGKCEVREFFPRIRSNVRRSVAANYVVELVSMIMQTSEPNPEVYDLLKNALMTIERTDDLDKIVHFFQIKILQISGFRPHLDSCVISGKAIAGRAKFSMVHGGLVAPEVSLTEDYTTMSRGTVASLLHIERSTWEQCLRLGLTQSARRELKYLLNNFLVYHLERKVRSADYLHRV